MAVLTGAVIWYMAWSGRFSRLNVFGSVRKKPAPFPLRTRKRHAFDAVSRISTQSVEFRRKPQSTRPRLLQHRARGERVVGKRSVETRDAPTAPRKRARSPQTVGLRLALTPSICPPPCCDWP
eukprot:1191813-Prorocentrum_minimum.AAC.4